MGGKNTGNNFSRNTRIVRAKNVGKKTSEKVRKSVFYIRTNIVPKNWGEKRAKQFFQKHTNSATKKVGKKSSEKSGKKRILYSQEYRDKKWGERNARNNFSIFRPFASLKKAHSGLWMGDSDGNRFRLDSVESKELGNLSSRVTVHRPNIITVCTIHIVPIFKYSNVVKAHSLFAVFVRVYVYVTNSFSGPRKICIDC